MKTSVSLFALSLLCFASVSARADISFILDAGELTAGASGAPMQADNTLGSANGSLLLLIDTGSSDNLSSSLNAGQYVSGTNTILAAGGFNLDSDRTAETITYFDVTGAPKAGDDIALRWFPAITLADFRSGTLPTANEYYGTYDPAGGNPDGGDTWTVPGLGAGEQLNFFTANSDGGGAEPASAGVASQQIGGVATVPEPSSYVLLGLGVLALMTIRRYRAQS